MSHRKIVLSVGFFILCTSLLILFSLGYVIKKKGVFEAHKPYKLLSKNAEEIEKGMPVLFSGFEIGQVSELGLNEKGEVIITLLFPEHNIKWLRQDSQFILERPLIGKAKIILNSSMNQPPLTEDTVLRMKVKDGINEVISNIQPIISQLQNIVGNIHYLTYSLTDNNASFQKTMKNIENFSSKLSNSSSLLGSITGNQKSATELHHAIENLNLALLEVQDTIINTNTGVSELRHDIIKPTASSIKQVQDILKDLRQKLQAMDKLVTTLSSSDKDINYFKNEMKVLLDEINEVSIRVNNIMGKERSDHVQLP